MRNKPRPENQCWRKWRRQARKARKYDSDGFDAALDSFAEIVSRVLNRRSGPTVGTPQV